VPARGVPLLQHFVYDLGDSVVDRVAEAGQELLVRRQARVEPGRVACWRRWPALVVGRAGDVGPVSRGPGGVHRVRSFRFAAEPVS
jgi:hypothetical protein